MGTEERQAGVALGTGHLLSSHLGLWPGNPDSLVLFCF